MSRRGALIVIGSGPGIGTHVAATFAQHGFRKVILMCKNAVQLSDDAMIIRSVAAGTGVDVFSVDLANRDELDSVLGTVGRCLAGTPPECIFFHTTRPEIKSKLLERSVECFQIDLQRSVVSLYTLIRWCMPQMLKLAGEGGYKPTLLVTSGITGSDPLPQHFSLAACRAAQCEILTSCAKEFGPKGVHCTMIDVQSCLQGDSATGTASNVAREAWKLFDQQHSKTDTVSVAYD